MTDLNDIPTAMSTSALETKLKGLKGKAKEHSQILTAKLATSQSGQNLLHIGTSLSSLPPDLHTLLTQLHPVLSSAETTEKQYLQHLEKFVNCGMEIRKEERRVHNAKECASLYQDLVAAERVVKKDAADRRDEGFSRSDTVAEKVDRVSSLERCAHTTLCLIQDLQSSTDTISAMTASKVTQTDSKNALPSMRLALGEDSERAQFIMKLSPRIRRLESDTIISLSYRLEETLKSLQHRREGRLASEDAEKVPEEEDLLLLLGHCMRGLALLGRGKEVESIFARVAIMPLIRSKVSMGSLDEGGPRGECAGLAPLLNDMITTIAQAFGPALQLADVMFDVGSKMEVDLVTAGVWAPIATALMADAGIKMAIFSPGIASILQANYMALDTFLSELAQRLLQQSGETEIPASGSMENLYYHAITSPETIQRAQNRIYSHPKTAEFAKKWNLPIYYQLRFGECCNRINRAIEQTKDGGWTTEVFTGAPEDANTMKNEVGFELSFFLELYEVLLSLWKSEVFLRPLTNRFLRGAVQLVGRNIAFIEDGLTGKIKFGVEKEPEPKENGGQEGSNGMMAPPKPAPYCWAESVNDVAAVAWELAILETTLGYDYVSVVSQTLASGDATSAEKAELRTLVLEVLKDASRQIRPLVEKMWNKVIVELITEKCSGPLAAVKGVAATYRMTNRPPPTQASPFVSTILRPFKEFSNEFSQRKPDHIGDGWKLEIISVVTDRYSAAVEELLTTVARTEVTLQNRRVRRATSGGISDGDKVKLQVYLDCEEFCKQIESVGVDPSSISGVEKLKSLTAEAAAKSAEKSEAVLSA
ncbi:unnamed protein product [Cylindrotheca closterium]|uniref:COG complex component COG2 C-terminal domain-containing protein n=1 Tax=Cylindrotheca closterium TaxID=2856 RepID=A0AAD2FFL4_9STRA|nr:unnamed protein product [Cylindrotheca closterium]